ncbi:MAG: hypothetical protein JO091_02505 [Acidobacteriaceae bacterium]|nr:hypothetical protein [Acidobacteriaceae bacterium]
MPDAAKFRLVAVDNTTALGGWLGFSQPLSAEPDNAYLCKQLFVVMLTAVAATFFFLAPGLVLRQHLVASGRQLAFIWIPVPGLLVVGLFGLVVWIGPHAVRPIFISRVTLTATFVYLAYRLLRVRLSLYTNSVERRVLLVVILLVSIGAAKVSYSLGPAGELFRGTISRTLEVGGVSDTRLSYHVLQLIAFREKPFGDVAKALYSSYGGWNFSHRGVLPSLDAAPIVLASPVRIPATMPDQHWTVFDPQGYAAYRITMVVIAACSLITVFGLAELFLPDRWALLAFLITVSAPFTIHEIYFIWPKLEAAGFVLVGAYLVFERRFFLAGLAGGLGYLCHPSALLAMPILFGLVVLLPLPEPSVGTSFQRIYTWGLRALALLAGLTVWLLLWRAVNGRHFAQGQFLSYFQGADGPFISMAHWLKDRFDSLCNTVVPLNSFLFHPDRPGLNSVEGPSPPVVHLNFQYWDGVPFGVGIVFFFCLLRILIQAYRKARAWLFLIVILPLLFYTVYWGGDNTGMLRTGLQGWFLALMIFSVAIWFRFLACSQRFWKLCSWALLFRVVEIVFILLVPAMATQHLVYEPRFALSDIACIFVMLTATIALCGYTFRWSEALRQQYLLATGGSPSAVEARLGVLRGL